MQKSNRNKEGTKIKLFKMLRHSFYRTNLKEKKSSKTKNMKDKRIIPNFS